MLHEPVKRLRCIKTDDGGVARGRVNHPSQDGEVVFFFFFFACCCQADKKHFISSTIYCVFVHSTIDKDTFCPSFYFGFCGFFCRTTRTAGENCSSFERFSGNRHCFIELTSQRYDELLESDLFSFFLFASKNQLATPMFGESATSKKQWARGGAN